MYTAKGNQIFYEMIDGKLDLFITINENQQDSTVDPHKQAILVAQLLNESFTIGE